MSEPKTLILIVDEDQNTRKAISNILAGSNYDTIEAKNGREALELSTKLKPDIILIDVMMPLIDGLSVCHYVKKDLKTRDILVLMLTSKGSKEDVVSAIKAGADDYMLKPFTKDALLQKIKKVLDLKRVDTHSFYDRRETRRIVRYLTVSWGSKDQQDQQMAYKERIIDVSSKGLSFEHARCDVCTGYEKDTVHPLCPFARFAKRFNGSDIMYFLIALPNNKIIEADGKIVHIYQPAETQGVERIGVGFTKISRESIGVIKQLHAHQ